MPLWGAGVHAQAADDEVDSGDDANANANAERTGGGIGIGSVVAASAAVEAEAEVEAEQGGDDEADAADEETRPRLTTYGEAYDYCDALIQRQLELAAEQRPPPNVAIRGDTISRMAFLLLLSDEMQRRLFLSTARHQASWPRIRSLFGSPPFHFLKPSDAYVLNASGFARGRAKMAYDDENMTANVAQFQAQFVDGNAREYRSAPLQANDDDPLPGNASFRSAGEVLLQVKIRKRSRRLKQQMMRNADTRTALFFPRIGEVVELRETARMIALLGTSQSARTRCTVRAVAPRGRGANTAALMVRVL